MPTAFLAERRKLLPTRGTTFVGPAPNTPEEVRDFGLHPVEAATIRIRLKSARQVPPELASRLVDRFGTLQSLFGASTAELREVDGVGPARARTIREGLVRLAESAYTDRLD